jgi:mannan endo-1,4-beta-mannosidase
MQRSLIALVGFAAVLTPIVLGNQGCGESHIDCEANSDCPENFYCDTEAFVGDCVQRVYVVSCGIDLCQVPYEVCVDGRCVDSETPDPGDDPVGGAGGNVPPGTGGDMPMGGGVGARPGGGGPVPPVDRPDAGPDAPVPQVLIESPGDGSLLIGRAPVLSGQVFDLLDRGEVRAVIDGDEPGTLVAVDGTGRFEHRVSVEPGSHTLSIVATQGDKRGEASVRVRVDFYVSIRNGAFHLGDTPFRFVGLNAPGVLQAAFDVTALGDDRVTALLRAAKELGVTVVRARAYDDRPGAETAIQTGPGSYNEAGLVALDTLIAKAGEQGVKLILTLGGGDDTYGGIAQYLRWGGYPAPIPTDFARFFIDGPVREHYKDHVATLLSRMNSVNNVRYAEDPAIMAWEILDAYDGQGAFATNTGNETNDFFLELVGVIRGNDNNHLVTTGDMGFDANPGPYGRNGDELRDAGLLTLLDGTKGFSWHRNTRIQAISFASIHVDPERFGFNGGQVGWSNQGAAWIRGHASLAALEGKPLVILNTRLPRASMPLDQRRAVLQAWFDELISLDVAGMMVGNFYTNPAEWMGDAAAWNFTAGGTMDSPEFEYADMVRNLATQLFGL